MNYTNSSNNSLESGNLILCNPGSPDTAFTKAWKTLIYCVIIIVSLFGNTLVLLVVYKKQQMRTTTNFLIVNMAGSDLLIAIFAVPPTIRSIYKGEDLLMAGFMAQVVCKLVTFFQQVSIAVSILSLTAIAFDRFFAVVFPFRQMITFRTTKIIILLTWFVGLGWNAPILYTNRIFPGRDSSQTVCREIWEPLFNSSVAQKNYTIVTFSFFYAGPLLVITILYTAIMIELWAGNSITNVNYEQVQRSNRKVFKMLVTVVIVFALFWLPVYIFQFTFYFERMPCSIPHLVQFLGYFLCHTTSAVNPLIFAIYSENYRNGFKEVLYALVHCQRKQGLFTPASNSVNNVREQKKVKLYTL